MYLLIETGYEGIETLCWLTENKDEALAKREEFIDKNLKHKKWIWIHNPKRVPSRQEIADFFCIQKWTGKKFVCACKELGIKTSKPMFR